jgi:hypothetical protein
MEEQFVDSQDATEEGNAKNHTILMAVIAIVIVLLAAGLLITLIIARQGRTGGTGRGKPASSNVQPEQKPPTAPATKEADQVGAESSPAAAGKKYNYTAPAAVSCESLASKEAIQNCKDREAFGKAVENKNSGDCQNIKNDSMKNDCLTRIASAATDPSVCDAITGAAARNRCVANIATDTNDIKLCEKLEGVYKSDCQQEVTAFALANDGDKTNLGKCRELKLNEFIALCLSHSYINKFGGNCDIVPIDFRQDCVKRLGGE